MGATNKTNIFLPNPNELTMSSREIANLTDKLHKNVLADIKNMFESLEIQSADFSADYKDSRGRTYQEYLLPKKYIECLLTGYSIPLRMKVIDRMHELENKNLFQIPQSYAEALRLSADLADKLQEAQPKVEFADLVGEADGVLIGSYAKTVGIGQNKLFGWLRENQILIMMTEKRNTPRDEYINRGYFTCKARPITTSSGVKEKFTTHITGKGQLWLTQKLKNIGLI